METDKDVSFSHLNEENVNLALVGVGEVGKSSLLNCIEVPIRPARRSTSPRKSRPPTDSNCGSRRSGSTTTFSSTSPSGTPAEIE
jgi:GTP-binding protein EngB required for normal cell division